MDKTLRASLQALKDYANGDHSSVEVERDKIAVLPKFTAKDVKNIRHKISTARHVHITQKVMAAILAVSPRTVESWEAGRSYPHGSSARLLQMINKNPNIIQQF